MTIVSRQEMCHLKVLLWVHLDLSKSGQLNKFDIKIRIRSDSQPFVYFLLLGASTLPPFEMEVYYTYIT